MHWHNGFWTEEQGEKSWDLRRGGGQTGFRVPSNLTRLTRTPVFINGRLFPRRYPNTSSSSDEDVFHSSTYSLITPCDATLMRVSNHLGNKPPTRVESAASEGASKALSTPTPEDLLRRGLAFSCVCPSPVCCRLRLIDVSVWETGRQAGRRMSFVVVTCVHIAM
ncbi:uncharacterized protein K489DRAFT_213713 [Dissoconium aciculare CBS 342.82]|uniref:Uncharacterized protein n=1 Tax=Dissoconium aciculare CBS 342.82 TaxID=1314786 RepID=A0A6J3M3S3_9PEZI|nr:uncharacterized protein K489DRAFT_213713 [Dissoconium aciculare CBS 342.82]KAF1822670.1 hypothetical protein K489DRAFT_213713 [Dissoconium aciculare CBS 342.82]